MKRENKEAIEKHPKICYIEEMRSTITDVKPFLKWAGGKSQLLSEIRNFYPQKIEKYCEPFVGGGAVLFDVLLKFRPKEILINDINPELTNCYHQIKNAPEDLINLLSNWQNQYQKQTQEERKTTYFKKRERFNDLIKAKENSLEKAALMIYLNKTCFNGLYRVNSKGLFNVPSGVYKNPAICNEDNLIAISDVLQNIEIRTGDYKQTKNFIDSNTFVYIDPPYRPLTESSFFTAYSENKFGDKEQIELGNFVNEIHAKGAKILLSNSDPKNVNSQDNFFDDLYRPYQIHRVNASRMINSKASERGKITELIVACL